MTVKNIEDMDYIDLNLYRDKNCTFYVRNNSAFIWCGNDKINLGSSFSVCNDKEISFGNTTPISLSGKDTKETGSIFIRIHDNYYLVGFVSDSINANNNHDVIIMKFGSIKG